MNNGKAAKHIVETIAKIIFLICAVVAIVAVLSITVYMFAKGTPALAKVGVTDLLFGTAWQPTAANPTYGIFYIICTSIIGTAVAIAIGVPIGILTAVFITEVSNKKIAAIVQPGSGITCCNSICNLWSAWNDAFESADVQTGKAYICGKHNPSVYRRREPFVSNYCTGNYDSSYRNQYQCIVHSCGTGTHESSVPCTWSDTHPDDF